MIDKIKLENVFIYCLTGKRTGYSSAIKVEGVLNNFCFNLARLDECKHEIKDWLRELPWSFFTEVGGSFSEACQLKTGEEWGNHQSIQQLLCLGMALGVVTCPLPSFLWDSLPNKEPCYIIDFDSHRYV